jgi:glycine/serine hydroxymethyltransferase
MTEPDMATIASLIARALKGRDNPSDLETVKTEAAALCAAHRPYPELG